MKKIMKHIITFLLIISVLVIASCSNVVNTNATQKKESSIAEQGIATVKMFVPDYYLMAEQGINRAIAPQSVSARLCYLVNGSWVGINTVNLSQATKTVVENAPEGFTGSVFTLSFNGVPIGIYAAGYLKIELLDLNGNSVTSGTNASAVTITKGASDSTTFYTVPESSTANSGNLSAGEMKFSRAALVKGVTYTLVITSSGDYPDLVLFGSDGKLVDYYAVDSEEESTVSLSVGSTDVYYLGLWADDGNAIARYTLSFDFGEGTQLSGVLTGANLHWTKENSPYFVNANILVEEGTKLTVDPGVIVQFTGNYYLKVTGSISAVGSKTDPIIFVQSGDNLSYWNGIKINSATSLNLTNTYAYASGNILKNCMVIGANYPMSLNSATYVDSCTFTGNSNYIDTNSNSLLINNVMDSGLRAENGVKIVNNIIKGYVEVHSATFINNTLINADIRFYGYVTPVFVANKINTCSLYIGNDVFEDTRITDNNFFGYDGSIIDVSNCYYANRKAFNFTGNYWGEAQTAEIESKCGSSVSNSDKDYNMSFLTDYYDNFENTKIDFSNWATEPIEGTGYLGDSFIAFDYTINGYNYENGGNYPESTETSLSIAVNPKYHAHDIAYIRIAQNSDVLKNTDWNTYSANQSFTVNKDSLVGGVATIYVQLKDSKGNISSPVMHEVPFDNPVISLSIADGVTYSNATSYVNLTYSATDKGNLSEYVLYIDDLRVISGNSWGNTHSSTYRIGLAYMSSGTHKIKSTFWDSAGNQTDKEIAFTINHNINLSSLIGNSYDATTGQLLKDNNTLYLWHLDTDSSEASGDTSLTLNDYTSGSGCFNGNAGYLYQNGASGIPIKLTNNAFTVECWRKGGDFNITKADSFSIEANRLCYNYETASGSTSSRALDAPSFFNDDNWHFWSYVYGGNYMAIYCDGILMCYDDGLTQTPINNDSGLYVWGYNIDELRISSVARSPDEIAAYYNAAKSLIVE